MKILALALCLYFSFGSAYGQETLLLRVGTLSLDVPSSWSFSGSNQRAEGRGPDGEGVIVSYRVLKPGAPDPVVEHHWKTIRGFASDRMPELASKNGEVLRPVTEYSLPEGRVQFSALSQGTKMFRSYYFLQYLLGSSRLMVYITVEGYGNASEASIRFEKILATQRWDE